MSLLRRVLLLVLAFLLGCLVGNFAGIVVAINAEVERQRGELKPDWQFTPQLPSTVINLPPVKLPPEYYTERDLVGLERSSLIFHRESDPGELHVDPATQRIRATERSPFPDHGDFGPPRRQRDPRSHGG